MTATRHQQQPNKHRGQQLDASSSQARFVDKLYRLYRRLSIIKEQNSQVRQASNMDKLHNIYQSQGAQQRSTANKPCETHCSKQVVAPDGAWQALLAEEQLCVQKFQQQFRLGFQNSRE